MTGPIIASARQKKVISGLAGILVIAAIAFVPFGAYSKIQPESPPVREPDTFTLLVQNAVSGPEGKNVSVYFYNPVTRQAYGVNENTRFAPASLLKLPVMLALLKEAESDQTILGKRLKVLPSDRTGYSCAIKSGTSLTVAESYTIESLISSMISSSDNTALRVLDGYLQKDRFRKINQVYLDFHFNVRDMLEKERNMSPREYSRFLLALMNASYLEPALSQKALSLLAQSEFTEGLAAGVPQGTKVAHKFGERGYTGTDTMQLHDCGIIYHPSSPYILCIMTRGTSLKDQAKTIASVSDAVFRAVTVGLL
ncbi:MAG: serine hydrolase [Chitinispirillaceae bacterium]|nr:serine hydrolase [Chitinispirillaceae bacterium]